MKNALRDNGTLIILDLWQSADLNDTLRSTVALFMSALPRAQVHQHWLWRYSVVWEKHFQTTRIPD